MSAATRPSPFGSAWEVYGTNSVCLLGTYPCPVVADAKARQLNEWALLPPPDRKWITPELRQAHLRSSYMTPSYRRGRSAFAMRPDLPKSLQPRLS